MIVFKGLGNMGRLGNCLFQAASTIGIATKNNHSFSFPEWKYQSYFKNPLPLYNDEPITHTLTEPSFSYHEFDIPQEGVININGYLQSAKYFEHCQELIRSTFEFSKKMTKQPATSIHIRRTDYTDKSDYHYNLPLEYYHKAMELCNDNLYIIFSDDIEWCKQQDWKRYNVLFSEGKSEIDDLQAMSMCRNNIIANSSFSWWASWLNTNPEKIVVAPEKYYWFGKSARHNDVTDLYLPSWKIINL
jgi:hypothetical protein